MCLHKLCKANLPTSVSQYKIVRITNDSSQDDMLNNLIKGALSLHHVNAKVIRALQPDNYTLYTRFYI